MYIRTELDPTSLLTTLSQQRSLHKSLKFIAVMPLAVTTDYICFQLAYDQLQQRFSTEYRSLLESAVSSAIRLKGGVDISVPDRVNFSFSPARLVIRLYQYYVFSSKVGP